MIKIPGTIEIMSPELRAWITELEGKEIKQNKVKTITIATTITRPSCKSEHIITREVSIKRTFPFPLHDRDPLCLAIFRTKP
jgi:hypothetical protein